MEYRSKRNKALSFTFRSPIKVAIERQKQHYKAGWLNSPNTYVKKEMEETGTTNPKKITKVRVTH